MTWIVAVTAAAVIVIVVLTAAISHRRMSDALAAARAELDDALRTTQHMETRVTTLRQELSEQHRENAELTARLRTAGDARAAGLWALERLRQGRLAGTPTLPTASGPGINVAADLHAAISLELELLREEVGTYAEVAGLELGNPVSPREALSVLRVVQELAAAFAKRSDELRITIERDGDAARVTVLASGWSEAIPNHAVLEQCVAALDGTLVLRPESGLLNAEVRIPDPRELTGTMSDHDHELRCRIPGGLWRALEERSAETGEPVRHLVATALAGLLDVDHQTIFQVSTVGALVEGVYEGAVRVGTLREHGDFGLGTFEGLDGELVALDGDFFRVRSDGALHPVADDVLSPYAMITHFVPDDVAALPGFSNLEELCAALDELRDSANHFFAFRIEGSFPSMHVRAACRVAEGTPLVDATARQREWNLQDVRGTIVGFWSPQYAADFDVPGYHFHVVHEDRQRGGHVLAASSDALTAATQRLEQLIVALPETADFLTADLRRDPSPALDIAERDHE